jgi:hypothetical protein
MPSVRYIPQAREEIPEVFMSPFIIFALRISFGTFSQRLHIFDIHGI